MRRVVICLLFITFVLQDTAVWRYIKTTEGCNLLTFYYFCATRYSQHHQRHDVPHVVICLLFITFVLQDTALIKNSAKFVGCNLLTFYYFCATRYSIGIYITACGVVVICLLFITFVLQDTANSS